MMQKRKGFTLIELLVVIAIIGILSSVVLASLNSARSKSRDARRVSDLKQLQLALELYYDANKAYPAGIAGAQTNHSDSPLVAGGYIATIPTDPSTNAMYTYAGVGASGSTCTSYHLGATLENSTNQALNGDADASASGTVCTGQTSGSPGGGSTAASASDFAGTDPIYDVKP